MELILQQLQAGTREALRLGGVSNQYTYEWYEVYTHQSRHFLERVRLHISLLLQHRPSRRHLPLKKSGKICVIASDCKKKKNIPLLIRIFRLYSMASAMLTSVGGFWGLGGERDWTIGDRWKYGHCWEERLRRRWSRSHFVTLATASGSFFSISPFPLVVDRERERTVT